MSGFHRKELGWNRRQAHGNIGNNWGQFPESQGQQEQTNSIWNPNFVQRPSPQQQCSNYSYLNSSNPWEQTNVNFSVPPNEDRVLRTYLFDSRSTPPLPKNRDRSGSDLYSPSGYRINSSTSTTTSPAATTCMKYNGHRRDDGPSRERLRPGRGHSFEGKDASSVSETRDKNAAPRNLKEFQMNSYVSSLSTEIQWIELDNEEQTLLICHFISWTDFFVLTKTSCENVNRIADIIYAHMERPSPLVQPNIGSLCLARFDGAYYRGEILRINGGTKCNFTIFFIDYGNSTVAAAEELFEMPFELKIVPRCAINCQWDMAVANELSPEVEESFASCKYINVTGVEKIADGQYLVRFNEFTPKTMLKLVRVNNSES